MNSKRRLIPSSVSSSDVDVIERIKRFNRLNAVYIHNRFPELASLPVKDDKQVSSVMLPYLWEDDCEE